MYKVYTITQNGKKRQIEEPYKELKNKQKGMIPFFRDFPFHPSCHSVSPKSIITNAQIHIGAKHILRVDIKSCYKNTNKQIIQDSCCSLKKYTDEELGKFNTYLDDCLWNNGSDLILPTGAPTSPILCNIALSPIDYFLAPKLELIGYKYSRYMDDLHISTTEQKRKWDIIDTVKEVIEQYGYTINKKKSKWMTVNSDKAIITGVNIGKGSRVPNSFYRMMRARLNNLARDNQPIDIETKGCLVYINSIDRNKCKYLIDYYEKRINKTKPI